MRALTFALGAGADARLGDPPTSMHPVGLVGRAARQLWMHAPDDEVTRRQYGYAVAFAVPLASALGASLIRRAVARKHAIFGLAFEVGLLSLTASARTLLARASEVEAALAAGNLEVARELLGTHLVSRDTSTLTSSEVAAAAIESVAENLSDGVIAPWLAYAVGGLPAAIAYRAANTMDALWGYRNEEFAVLGEGAARLDDLLNLVPAQATAVALVLAARAEGTALRALSTWRRDAQLTESPHAGHPMSAMAGALGVRLEKRDAYVLGAGFEDATPDDLGRAIRVARRAMIIGGSAIVGALVLRSLQRGGL